MAEESSIPKIHLLPCNISYDGPAPISNYFQVKASPDQSQYTSHFRGRKLVGKKVDLVVTPTALVTAVTKETMPDAATKTLQIQTPIDNFILWGHDNPSAINFQETYSELLEVSQALHGMD